MSLQVLSELHEGEPCYSLWLTWPVAHRSTLLEPLSLPKPAYCKHLRFSTWGLCSSPGNVLAALWQARVQRVNALCNPGAALKQWWQRLVDKYPGCLPWVGTTLQWSLFCLLVLPQQNCAPVASCDRWLDNMPFISFPPLLILFPRSPPDVSWDHFLNKWQN